VFWMVKKPALLFVFLVLLDWATKALVLLLGLSYTKNYGIAFGLLQSSAFSSWIYHTVLTLVSLVYLEIRLGQKRGASYVVALFLSGAFGNLVSKLTWGYMVDFITLPGLGSFNLADVYLVAGLIGILADELRS